LETFNLEVGFLSIWAASVLSLLANNISDAVQQGKILSLMLSPGVIFLKQQALTETTKVVG
jgi:hypothetical protein